MNIEVEGPSTSISPSELLPHESMREFDSDGVEVIHFQPAQFEYHDNSRGARGAEGGARAAEGGEATGARAAEEGRCMTDIQEETEDECEQQKEEQGPSKEDTASLLKAKRTRSVESVHSDDSDSECQYLITEAKDTTRNEDITLESES